MKNEYLHRHDLTDEQWSALAPILPGQKGQWEGAAKDNRLFMNAVLWILRTGHLGVTCRGSLEMGKRTSAVSSVAGRGCLEAYFKRISEASRFRVVNGYR